ncbi:unnamed protein product [Arabidopsis thaliana]|uniref:Uncharacterized protein n=1 Tax=Arabidopsis thaliana TaxID=3702 RepID=A0A654ERK3_ARATH|nr:unnamed protein product [Arabidopsis thaliana]
MIKWFRLVHGVFSFKERTFPAKARRYWRRNVAGVYPVRSMPGVCLPSVNSSGGCVSQFSRRKKCRPKPTWPWNRDLKVMLSFSSYESVVRLKRLWSLMLSNKEKRRKNKIKEVEFPWRNRGHQSSNFKTTTPLARFLKWNLLIIFGPKFKYSLVLFAWMEEDGHIFYRNAQKENWQC